MITIEQIKQLNDLEYEIYLYLINHSDVVVKAKLSDIAKTLHVSSSMITRVCKKLGFEGFTQFKVQMRYNQEKEVRRQESDSEYLIDFFKKIDNQESKALLQRAAGMMAKSSEILFFGIGLSGAMAEYGAYLFNRRGFKSFYVDDFSHRFNVYDPDTCVVILTVSGETKETNNQIMFIKETGAKVIVISNSVNTTAAKLADENICYYIPSSKDSYFYSSASQVPVVYILENLIKEIEKV